MHLVYLLLRFLSLFKSLPLCMRLFICHFVFYYICCVENWICADVHKSRCECFNWLAFKANNKWLNSKAHCRPTTPVQFRWPIHLLCHFVCFIYSLACHHASIQRLHKHLLFSLAYSIYLFVQHLKYVWYYSIRRETKLNWIFSAIF